MQPIIFHCPMTGLKVQALVPEGAVTAETLCVAVDCPICNRPHLIDPATGKVPGDSAED